MGLLKLVNTFSIRFLEELMSEDNLRRYKNVSERVSEVREKLKLELINELMKNYSIKKGVNEKLEQATVMISNVVDALLSLGFRTIVLDARLITPAIFGVSQGVLRAVFEVSMAWDHIIDLPYIPASSVKGAVRGTLEHLLISRYAGNDDELKKCLDCVDVLFGVGGHEGWAGLLLFFDAYPIGIRSSGGRLLEPDIVSPHYMHGTEVTRFERLVEPVPVPHVSIAPGVVFRFIVAAEPSQEVEEALNCLMQCFGKNAEASLGAKIASLLVTAFRFGIGARTSRGYGKFEVERMEIKVGNQKVFTPAFFEPSIKRMGRGVKRGGKK